jgi:hypothetical protein
MCRPNWPLLLVSVVLVLLVTAVLWVLSTRRPEPPKVGLVVPRSDSAQTIALSPLEDPGHERGTPEPAHAPAPAPLVVEQNNSRPMLDAVRMLQKTLPKQFGKLTPEEAEAITTLDLRGASITDADLALLSALPNLATLSLHGTAITDAGLAYLRDVKKLTSIDLRATTVTGSGIALLPTERIESLHLTDTQVKGDELRWLPPMPKLQVLKLNRLDMDDTALVVCAGMPALQHVELDGTKISDDGLRRLLRDNRGLRRVELRETPVTKATIEELSALYPGVELVSLSPELTLGTNH